MENGVLRIYAGRKRIFQPVGPFGWTVGSSIIPVAMALLFLRAQVRPIPLWQMQRGSSA